MSSRVFRSKGDIRTTTQRGYGADHQRERKRRLPLHTERDPCGYCGRPLGPDCGRWHLPHKVDRSGYLPGFWHDTCNVREGAERGRITIRRPRPPRQRDWYTG